jgi:predicted amidohydrolase
VKVAAFQAPLLAGCSIETVVGLIRKQVDVCESEGVEILCCPEAVLGGLADYVPRPTEIAIDVEHGQLDAVLAPLASNKVTTIVGFTEVDGGRLYNAAAVFHSGSVAGISRKQHPAINRSVYDAGQTTPLFTVGTFTFGILICRDSTDSELARMMASQNAAALFVPTNNGLPPGRAGQEIVAETQNLDTALAVKTGLAVIRADVTGRAGDLLSYGSSAIVDRRGQLLTCTQQFSVELIVAHI